MKQLVLITADVQGDPHLKLKSNWTPITPDEFNRVMRTFNRKCFELDDKVLKSNPFDYLVEKIGK